MQTIIGAHQQVWHDLEQASRVKRQEPPIVG